MPMKVFCLVTPEVVGVLETVLQHLVLHVLNAIVGQGCLTWAMFLKVLLHLRCIPPALRTGPRFGHC